MDMGGLVVRANGETPAPCGSLVAPGVAPWWLAVADTTAHTGVSPGPPLCMRHGTRMKYHARDFLA